MTRRAQQAAQTRSQILRAARRLFAAHGYAGTSVTRVAAEAGVSVQTIYDAVGSKSALAAALNEAIDEEADVATLARVAAVSDDPHEVMAVPVRITGRLLERCGDLLRTIESAAGSAPELARVRTQGQQRHSAGCSRVAGRLQQLGALGVSLDEAVRTLTVLTDTEVARACVEDYGWSVEQWEEWTVQALRRLVLTS